MDYHNNIYLFFLFVHCSPTKHVVVGGTAPLQVPPQQYVPVPVSMVEPTSTQRMLLTNRVQTNTVAWPQGGRQVLVPSWSQQAAPHSLIVDSAPFLNMEEIYPKHHLNLPRHELKKESPVHHLPLVLKSNSIDNSLFLSHKHTHLHSIKYILYNFHTVYRVTIRKKRISCHRSRSESKRIPHRTNNDIIGLTYRHSIIRVPIT